MPCRSGFPAQLAVSPPPPDGASQGWRGRGSRARHDRAGATTPETFDDFNWRTNRRLRRYAFTFSALWRAGESGARTRGGAMAGMSAIKFRGGRLGQARPRSSFRRRGAGSRRAGWAA